MMVTILDDGHHTGTEVHKLKQYTILVVGGYLHTSTPNIIVGGRIGLEVQVEVNQGGS